MVKNPVVLFAKEITDLGDDPTRDHEAQAYFGEMNAGQDERDEPEIPQEVL